MCIIKYCVTNTLGVDQTFAGMTHSLSGNISTYKHKNQHIYKYRR